MLKHQFNRQLQPFEQRPIACEPRGPPSSACVRSDPAGNHGASGEARYNLLAAVNGVSQIQAMNQNEQPKKIKQGRICKLIENLGESKARAGVTHHGDGRWRIRQKP